ncbi:Uncharacterised protein [Salmonella enterica subsp. arizonae]|uniref:Uncharacterized protein n=1 Tax=Salmonella enterica subsp. arizonae TaxID=59203 RepID=A0A379T423_SALER|nr:Uncharacterised protein [Salmonella enterica subsp. arizonae]
MDDASFRSCHTEHNLLSGTAEIKGGKGVGFNLCGFLPVADNGRGAGAVLLNFRVPQTLMCGDFGKNSQADPHIRQNRRR